MIYTKEPDKTALQPLELKNVIAKGTDLNLHSFKSKLGSNYISTKLTYTYTRRHTFSKRRVRKFDSLHPFKFCMCTPIGEATRDGKICYDGTTRPYADVPLGKYLGPFLPKHVVTIVVIGQKRMYIPAIRTTSQRHSGA